MSAGSSKCCVCGGSLDPYEDWLANREVCSTPCHRAVSHMLDAVLNLAIYLRAVARSAEVRGLVEEVSTSVEEYGRARRDQLYQSADLYRMGIDRALRRLAQLAEEQS